MGETKTLTIRLSPDLHERVRWTADTLHLTINGFVEQTLEKEVRARRPEVAEELERVLAALKTHGADESADDIEAFAAAEVREKAPLASRAVSGESKD
jgi:predicted transcriptional regulator